MPQILATTLSRLCNHPLTPTHLGLTNAGPRRPTITTQFPADPAAPPAAPDDLTGDHTNRRAALNALGAVALSPLLASGTAAADAAAAYTRGATTSELDAADIADLEVAVHRLGAIYPNHRPRELWPIAARHRHQADHLLHHRRHTLKEGRELARNAGMLSVVLAWLAHDLGDRPTMDAFAADAFAHGDQADAPEVCAWAEDVIATHALYDNRPLDALAAATRGHALAPRGSNAAIRVTAQLSRARARLGDAEGFKQAAALAHTYQEHLPATATGLFAVDAARIVSYDASSLIWLDQPAHALASATEAINYYRGASASAPTRLVIAQLDLAMAHTALGAPDAAVELGLEALNASRPVNAITERARQLDHVLLRNYPVLPEVVDFHERIRTAA
jgi:hypothetical protein